MKRLLGIFGWLAMALVTLFLSLGYYLNLAQLKTVSFRPRIAFSSVDPVGSHAVLPEVLGAFTFSVKPADAIPEIVKNYLKKYSSPLYPQADFLVETARNNNLAPRLLVAIAQQESNLCKKIPDDSFNCWGWGIHSRGTLKFTSYEEAMTAVIKGLSENYFGEGLTTPEAIMGIYTPLSDGSWARGVQQFIDEMK